MMKKLFSQKRKKNKNYLLYKILFQIIENQITIMKYLQGECVYGLNHTTVHKSDYTYLSMQIESSINLKREITNDK